MLHFMITSMVLLFIIQLNNACVVKSVIHFIKNKVVKWNGFDHNHPDWSFINDGNVDIRYWNSYHGNDKSFKIRFGHESQLQSEWIPDLPLKVIIHGWLDSADYADGAFCIKTAYVDVGGYNVISVDWGVLAGNRNYMWPAMISSKIGSRVAKVLDNIVELGIVRPKDIHLIGHSLGAHVAGACGSSFKSGKIGRITGLDPAGPGFEFAKLKKKGLKRTDADFVDVIHTSGGATGYLHSLGHADFYPNGGSAPQPGCSYKYESNQITRVIEVVGCSHSRANKLYVDSVYNMNSITAVACSSWIDYQNQNCDMTCTSPMGHDASPRARGDFYLKTNSFPPYAFLDELQKEDL